MKITCDCFYSSIVSDPVTQCRVVGALHTTVTEPAVFIIPVACRSEEVVEVQILPLFDVVIAPLLLSLFLPFGTEPSGMILAMLF